MSVGAAAATVVAVAIVAALTATGSVTDQPALVGDLRIRTESFAFTPPTLTSAAGDVAVRIDNSDPALHTFTIDALNVHVRVPPRARTRVNFTAPPGTYRFYCQPHPHMRGTLTMPEPG